MLFVKYRECGAGWRSCCFIMHVMLGAQEFALQQKVGVSQHFDYLARKKSDIKFDRFVV